MIEKITFVITRYFALAMALVGIIILAGTALLWTKLNSRQLISYEQVAFAVDTNSNSASKEKPADNATAPDPLKGVKLPSLLQERFSTENNKSALKDWMERLPADKRQRFLDDLGVVIGRARQDGVTRDRETQILNHYFEMWLEQSNDKFSTVLDSAAKVVLGLCVAMVLLMLTIVALVLAVLSIELNTRSLRNTVVDVQS